MFTVGVPVLTAFTMYGSLKSITDGRVIRMIQAIHSSLVNHPKNSINIYYSLSGGEGDSLLVFEASGSINMYNSVNSITNMSLTSLCNVKGLMG